MPSKNSAAVDETANMNHLCIIEGEYQVSKRTLSELRAQLKLDPSLSAASCSRIEEFIDMYKQNLADQDARSLSVVYSKDGSELLTYLLNNYGLASLLTEQNANDASSSAKTIHHFNTVSNLAAGESTANIHSSASSNNNSSAHFICFIINDFEQSDQIFLKLEEIQLKINNLLNLKSTASSSSSSSGGQGLAATTSTSALVSNQAPHKRFIIFGWPVLFHCIKNEIVSLAVCVYVLSLLKLLAFSFVFERI
jgi:hypothetical protein